MAANDVYLLSLRQLLNTKTCVNVHAVRWDVTGDPTTSDFQTLAVIFASTWKNVQVDDLSYVDWHALKVFGAGVTYQTTAPYRVSSVALSGTYSPAQAGVLTGTPLPNSNALVATLNTTKAGKRYRGRMYLAGVAEVWVDDSSLVNATQLATFQGNLNAAVTALGASGSNASWTWGVWSDRIATGVTLNDEWPRKRIYVGPQDPANAFTPITSATGRNYIGSQRDRRPGI